MHLLECVFTLEHCTALRWCVAHLGRFSYLALAHPVVGPPFYRYRERARRRFVLEVVLEESRVVALMYTCIRTFKFNVCIV